MTKKYSPIVNAFTESRGDPSFIEIKCGKCHFLIFVYQKDGPGPLKRSYLDRVHESAVNTSQAAPILKCPQCERKLGCLDNYEKENRLAIYWFAKSVEAHDLS